MPKFNRSWPNSASPCRTPRPRLADVGKARQSFTAGAGPSGLGLSKARKGRIRSSQVWDGRVTGKPTQAQDEAGQRFRLLPDSEVLDVT